MTTDYFNPIFKAACDAISSKIDCIPLKTIINFVLDNEHLDLADLIYGAAIGSNLEKKLNLKWESKENSYFVHPAEFFQWCIDIGLHRNINVYEKDSWEKRSVQISSYISGHYLFGVPFNSDQDAKTEKVRNPHTARMEQHHVIRIVEVKIKINSKITLESLLQDCHIRDVCKSYKRETVTNWIKESYPQFKRGRGRPKKTTLSPP